MIRKICPVCGKVLLRKDNRKLKMCWECYRKNLGGDKNPNWKGGQVLTKCEICGKEVYRDISKSNTRTCSVSCSNKLRGLENEKVYIKCPTCGKEFRQRTHGKKGGNKFCSTKCFALSPEQKLVTANNIRTYSANLTEEQHDMLSKKAVERCTGGYSSGLTGDIETKKGGKIHYRSSYEKKSIELMERCLLVDKFIYEPIVIKYKDENEQTRRYIPDFLVYWNDGTTSLVEIKPLWQVGEIRFIMKMCSGVMVAKQIGIDIGMECEYEIWNEHILGEVVNKKNDVSFFFYHVWHKMNKIVIKQMNGKNHFQKQGDIQL